MLLLTTTRRNQYQVMVLALAFASDWCVVVAPFLVVAERPADLTDKFWQWPFSTTTMPLQHLPFLFFPLMLLFLGEAAAVAAVQQSPGQAVALVVLAVEHVELGSGRAKRQELQLVVEPLGIEREREREQAQELELK